VSRRGFTLIELLVTVTLIGILANLGYPAYTGLRRRAEAARVITDMATIRVAMLDHYAQHDTYPATGSWGVAPPTLAASLPQGFEFHYRDVDYRWERWALPNGLPSDPSQTVLVAVSVRSGDAHLMEAIRNLYKGGISFGSASQITFVLE
jgi:prepilin-type N-terminal cleavage/methylation domain-containing protein